MALFGGKKKEVKAKRQRRLYFCCCFSEPRESLLVRLQKHDMLVVSFLHLRITEKATVKADAGKCVCFEIANDANKTTVSQAIKTMYNVIPVRVNITPRNPGKKHMSRGKMGFTQGVKAYVYIKKGRKSKSYNSTDSLSTKP